MQSYRNSPKPEHQRQWDKGVECLESGDGNGAVYVYTALANDGCGAALAQLGRIYEWGIGGIKQDFGTAVKWFRYAVETTDDLQSHLALARIYLQEPSLDKDHELARYHLRLLAENDIVGGYFGLGLVYEFGLGVEKNSIQALDWYEKAASRGHTMAHLHATKIRFEQAPLRYFPSLVDASLRVLCLRLFYPHDPRLAMWDDAEDSMTIRG